jgi:phosphoglycolate phosphatase
VSSRTRLILVDLDNTLYDWVAFFVPSMPAMLSELCDMLDARMEDLLSELRSVYERHGLVEYAFSIQALPSVGALPPERRRTGHPLRTLRVWDRARRHDERAATSSDSSS